MRRDPACLAFDLGATSWRAILGRRRRSGLALEEVHRERHAPVERDGALYWDFDALFGGMKGVLRMLAERGVQIASLGIDSWSVDYGLLDESGMLLEQPRCYRDPRHQGMAARLTARVGLENIFARTGLIVEDITTLCQLMAASEQTPTLLRRAARLLFMPDLLRFRLCGVEATDFTLATTSQMYDIRRRCWDTELLGLLDIPARILPEVRCGHSVLGFLGQDIQEETGLGAVPVTTGASHDTAAAFMTQPPDEESAILSSGTWSMLGVHLPAPLFSPSIDPTRFGHEGNPDGSVRMLCNIPGMWILEQCREAWRREGADHSYDALVSGAAECSSFQSRIDPYDAAFTLPPDMPEEIRKYCARTGQEQPRTSFEMARAIFLGLAESYARALRELSLLCGRTFRRLRVIGGGVRNDLLNAMIQERTGVAVIRGEAEATAVGNIQSQERALAALSATTT